MLSDKIRLNAFCHVDANGKWQKMEKSILRWYRYPSAQNLIYITLEKETETFYETTLLRAREHYLAKGWYATEDGRMLHYTKKYGLREVAPETNRIRQSKKFLVTKNGVCGSNASYLFLPSCLNKLIHQRYLHTFIHECWYGARTPGMQIDHLNGCELDNRPINLDEVTPEENRYRGVVIDSMRKARYKSGTPVYKMQYYEREPFRLIDIFDTYRNLYRPKTNNDVLKLAINPSYNTRDHSHGVVIKK